MTSPAVESAWSNGAPSRTARAPIDDPSTHTAKFEGVRTSIVNAVRRIVLSEIPCIAAVRDEARPINVPGGFVVRENTGRIHNDALVDRIALVPIHLTRSEVRSFIPGSLTVTLKVANNGSARINVTSRDLRVNLFDAPHPNGPRCYPPCPITGDWPLITRLYPGESIDLVATMEKATASRHAAFATVSLAAMSPALDADKYMAERREIERDETLREDARTEALNLHDHIRRKQTIKYGDDGEPVWHDLKIESVCGLTAREICAEAIEILANKFSSSALAYEATTEGDSLVFTISGQGHTFGNVLQDLCMNGREELGIRSIGYYETHPLEDRVVIRVDFGESPDERAASADAQEVITKLRAHCLAKIEGVRDSASLS